MDDPAELNRRFARAKWAYVTRRVAREDAVRLLAGRQVPTAGDLVLARVDERGQHRRLELTSSRRAELFEGDEIVVAYGNRYAPDQFEGMVPEHLGRCRLVAAGGVAARLLNAHRRMKSATRITPLGLLADAAGDRLNLARYRLPPRTEFAAGPLCVAVAGTAMNSGKTTVCSNLVQGLARRRVKVAAAKVTGTGAGADYRALVDAGADPAFDFVDAGQVSTYRAGADVLRDVFMTLCGHLADPAPDVIVLEIADGLLQAETAALLAMPAFRERVDGLLFAASDALGATAGVAQMAALGVPVIGVTGVLTSAPLAVREAQDAIGLPVFDSDGLRRTHVAGLILDCLASRRRRAGR